MKAPSLASVAKTTDKSPSLASVAKTTDKSPSLAEGDLGGGYENLENSKDDKNSTISLNLSKNSKENSQSLKNDNFANAKFDPPPSPLRKGGGIKGDPSASEGESMDSNQKSPSLAEGDLGGG
ncbi:hypothetical protein, partial [Campylobacter troglodytis]|uniref:hypothetical protein n=1 Tax=Campylobacter troglodytis TaxID=654363 RepID=UPI00115BE3DF